jgi:hypothetical protein
VEQQHARAPAKPRTVTVLDDYRVEVGDLV